MIPATIPSLRSSTFMHGKLSTMDEDIGKYDRPLVKDSWADCDAILPLQSNLRKAPTNLDSSHPPNSAWKVSHHPPLQILVELTCLTQREMSGIPLPYEGPSTGHLMLGLQILPLALHSFIKGSTDLGIGHAMEYKIGAYTSVKRQVINR